MKKKLYTTAALFALLLAVLTGCKKFVDLQPPVTKLAGDNVYAVDATAAAVLTGIYTGFNNGSFATGDQSITLRAGLSADEFTYYTSTGNNNVADYYYNGLTALRTDNVAWQQCYKYLNVANAALEGLTASQTLTPALKQQLTGEALFIRAFLHFYLVNLYGDVPLVTTSDYRVNNVLSRAPVKTVYAQIVTDLKRADSLLSTDYRDGSIVSSTSDRVRPNKAVAEALLARVYLYTGDWADAETESTKLISNTTTYSLTGLNDVFSTTSTEAIWQLGQTVLNMNTLDGQEFILAGAPDYGHPATLSPQLMQAFEPNDQRKVNWVGSVNAGGNVYYYAYKYKVASGTPVVEYLTVLRLAEQYLIRAEARAQLGKTAEASADLNAIRNRAGLPGTTATTKADLLTAILHERQVELFSEWGHRWLDLKRTGQVDAVMSVVTPLKGGVWKSTSQLYPLPQVDISRDPNLKQNHGY